MYVACFQLLLCAMGLFDVSCLMTLIWTLHLLSPSCSCPAGCRCSETEFPIFRVDCSRSDLFTVPGGIPPIATFLDLSHNKITHLRVYSMANLTRLTKLDLSYNNIEYIDVDAFQGLINLRDLNLKANALNISDASITFPPILFKPLLHLNILNIHENFIMLSGYPEQMWFYLPNLEELYIDGIPDGIFDTGFSALRQLRSLSLLDSYIGSVQHNTFEGLNQTSIQTLDLTNCNIKIFDGRAFQYIATVRKLLMSNNPLGKNVLDMGSGLQLIPTLEHLALDQTRLGDSFVQLITDYLCNSSLKVFTVSNNCILHLDHTISKCLPKLERFSLASNSLYVELFDLVVLFNLPSIRFLNMSSQENRPKISGVCSNAMVSDAENSCAPSFAFKIPPFLEVLDVSDNGINAPHIYSVLLLTPVNMQFLGASNTGIVNFTGQIYCEYTPVVHEVDIRDNDIEFINQTTFAMCDWTSMRILRMGGNNLSHTLAEQMDKPFFKPLSCLQVGWPRQQCKVGPTVGPWPSDGQQCRHWAKVVSTYIAVWDQLWKYITVTS